MNDDKTVLKNSINPQSHSVAAENDRTVLKRPPALQVILRDSHGVLLSSYTFTEHFNAGRSSENAIVLSNHLISRHHLEVKWEAGCWWIYNLKSTHGVFIHDQLITDKARLELPARVGLGASGLVLEIQLQGQSQPRLQELPAITPTTPTNPITAPATQPPSTGVDKVPPPASKTNLSPEEIRNRLMRDEDTDDMGEHTIMVRRLIREDRVVRSKSYKKVIWILGILFVLSAMLVTYQHVALNNARSIAINMFYDIKTLEVSLSQADLRLEESERVIYETKKQIHGENRKEEEERIAEEQRKIVEDKIRLAQEREKLKSMKARYQTYIEEINFLRISFPTSEQYEKELITRVARGFGESELEVPDDFIREVQKYIKLWQSSGRMQMAVNKLQENHYAPIIVEALEKQGLPPYFLYLPMQESNYDTNAIGPETRYGVAKGAWQFLAGTGQDFGLTPGPLANTPEYDEKDSRFDFNQATIAGAKYLKKIYTTQAQASGLLVLASYNYGHNRVRSMIQEMPDNPRDKNFWRFIQQYEIPKETYDYVFYIFSAAVIGEDPKHFKFNFPPLLMFATKEVG